jgi:hypothetical protein
LFFLSSLNTFSQSWTTGSGCLYLNPTSTRLGIGKTTPASNYLIDVTVPALTGTGGNIGFGSALSINASYSRGSIDSRVCYAADYDWIQGIFGNYCNITVNNIGASGNTSPALATAGLFGANIASDFSTNATPNMKSFIGGVVGQFNSLLTNLPANAIYAGVIGRDLFKASNNTTYAGYFDGKLNVQGDFYLNGRIRFNNEAFDNIWVSSSSLYLSAGPNSSGMIKINSGSVSILTQLSVSGTISGNGSGLTNLNAAYISGTYGNITSIGTITGNGSGLTNLGASNITGTYGNIKISGEGDPANIEWSTHPFKIWGTNTSNPQVLYMGVNTSKNISYIQSCQANIGATTLVLNSRGGSVAIGTTTATYDGSTYKLAVKGGILAEEVRVINPGLMPDYVFEDNYKLSSLSEKEQYVRTNKHLPGIPSAKEFEKKGYSVGEMDNMLLKQVEELTLHMIALEKENKRLAEEVEQLKNK